MTVSTMVAGLAMAPDLQALAAPFMRESSARLFLFLVDATIRGSALLAAAWLATRFMAKSSAGLRHMVWYLAVGGLLLLPLLGKVMPIWRVLPASLDWESGISQSLLNAEAAGRGSADAQAKPAPEAPEAIPGRLAKAIALIWVFGGVLVVIHWAAARVRLWRITRTARPFNDPGWAASLDEARRLLLMDRPIRLFLAPPGTMPMIWGIRRPAILLPEEAPNWPPESRAIVLLHELAHVQRWDGLTLLACHAAAVLCWFNPLYWFARSQVLLESERACDDVVLEAGLRPTTYAERLLGIVSQCGGGQWARRAAIAMARPGTLEGRLIAILDEKRTRRASAAGMLVAWALTVALALPLAACRTVRAPLAPPSPPPARQPATVPAGIAQALSRPVMLTPPYPLSYKGAPTDKLSVQYAVIEIANQAGLGYDWKTSFANTDPVCRQWIQPQVTNIMCGDALDQILDPVGLKYQVVNGQIVLERK